MELIAEKERENCFPLIGIQNFQHSVLEKPLFWHFALLAPSFTARNKDISSAQKTLDKIIN